MCLWQKILITDSIALIIIDISMCFFLILLIQIL